METTKVCRTCGKPLGQDAPQGVCPECLLKVGLGSGIHETGLTPELVRRLTSDTARAAGLLDRGVIAPGMKADLNVIDWDRLGAGSPYVVNDLPAGGKRLMQKVMGYDATVLSGRITFRGGEPTGDLPGKLVRGPQAAA